jgi:hypothetical protein
MVRLTSRVILTTAMVIGGGWLTGPLHGQTDSPDDPAVLKTDGEAAARNEVLESDRWRRTQREWNEWLSVQQSYSTEEVAEIQAELVDRMGKMSADELESFRQEMEERLDVLLSPEAEAARDWMSQFFSVVRNPEEHRKRKRADVVNMTAREIRQEIRRFQQQRAATQQSQTAFTRARANKAELAQRQRADRREAQAQAQQVRSRAAANMVYRSRYAPRPESLPHHSDFVSLGDQRPVYAVSPWGTPIRWDPLHAHNR